MSNIFVATKLVFATMLAKLNARFDIKSQKGVTIIEYALIGSLIAVAVIAAMTNVATSLNSLFTTINSKL